VVHIGSPIEHALKASLRVREKAASYTYTIVNTHIILGTTLCILNMSLQQTYTVSVWSSVSLKGSCTRYNHVMSLVHRVCMVCCVLLWVRWHVSVQYMYVYKRENTVVSHSLTSSLCVQRSTGQYRTDLHYVHQQSTAGACVSIQYTHCTPPPPVMHTHLGEWRKNGRSFRICSQTERLPPTEFHCTTKFTPLTYRRNNGTYSSGARV